ncbi:MAG TPA: hypothetical protein VF807_08555 [Ktedonobacterales bacterium]
MRDGATRPTSGRSRLRRVLPMASLFGLLLLASCGFRPASDLILVVRDGVMWTIHPDGTEKHQVGSATIVSAAWSPDHHQIVARGVARGGALDPGTAVRGAPDARADLYVTTVNGNSLLQITPQENGVLRGDAWWNPNGNRLLYTERFQPANGGFTAPLYVSSQADQPAGIARTGVSDAVTVPVQSPDGSRVAVIDSHGNVRLGPPGKSGDIIATAALATYASGHPGRILWQPRHDALVWAQAGSGGVVILRQALGSRAAALGMVPSLRDMAFSPDGSHLLLSTGTDFQVWDMRQPGHAVAQWTEGDAAALPWWSPGGGRVLVMTHTDISVVEIASGARTTLVTLAEPLADPVSPIGSWHPATAYPWSADGASAVFTGTPGAATSGAGVYVTPVGHAGPPRLIDAGTPALATWGSADPSTCFLIPA